MSADVKPGWMNIARHLQAITTQNQGYAIVTIKIVVAKDTPLFWHKAQVNQIQPMSIIGLEVTKPLVGLLAALADHVDDE